MIDNNSSRWLLAIENSDEASSQAKKIMTVVIYYLYF
jgi:hypothetical protein